MSERKLMTREEALRKHREMWTAMQKELGDNPSKEARIRFKSKWCEQHEKDEISCLCYLCQYANEHGLKCSKCLVDWGSIIINGHAVHGCCAGKTNCYKSPISEILALPERKVNGHE